MRKKVPNSGWIAAGIFLNIIGSGLTVLMIVLERLNFRNILTVDYPLFFMRCGILADMFCYLIAILKKWHYQEKQLAFQRMEKVLAVEMVRNHISSQLHDDIGSTLSGVSMYSHLANDLLEKGEQENAKNSLLVIQKSADEMVEKLGDLVWMVSPKPYTIQLVFERLEQYAFQMCNVKNIQLKLNISTAAQRLQVPDKDRYHVYLIIKEAINNAVKYSNASLLELSVKEVEGELEFSVSDNGKGFDAVMVRPGNGLVNMQQRADEIGAKLLIQSQHDGGSQISLRCKIT